MGRKVSIEFEVKKGNVYLDGEAVLPTSIITKSKSLGLTSNEDLSNRLLEFLTEELTYLDPDTVEEDEDGVPTEYNYSTPEDWMGKPIIRKKDRALRDSLLSMLSDELSQCLLYEVPSKEEIEGVSPEESPVVMFGEEFEEFVESIQEFPVNSEEFELALEELNANAQLLRDAKHPEEDHPAVQAAFSWLERFAKERKRFK